MVRASARSRWGRRTGVDGPTGLAATVPGGVADRSRGPSTSPRVRNFTDTNVRPVIPGPSWQGWRWEVVSMTTQQERGEAFRALHEGEPFVIPNPWDAGSARVLEGLGFPALATTSSGFA